MTLSTFDAKSVLASKEASSSQHPSVEVDLGVEPDVVCLGNLARITLIYLETQFCRLKTKFDIDFDLHNDPAKTTTFHIYNGLNRSILTYMNPWITTG